MNGFWIFKDKKIIVQDAVNSLFSADSLFSINHGRARSSLHGGRSDSKLDLVADHGYDTH